MVVDLGGKGGSTEGEERGGSTDEERSRERGLAIWMRERARKGGTKTPAGPDSWRCKAKSVMELKQEEI